MAKQTPVDVNTLPTLDDFMESNNLQGSPGQTKKPEPAATAASTATDPPAGADDAKKKADAEAKAKADKAVADEAKKKADELATVEALKKKEKEKKGITETELTQEQLDLLAKKAEEKPETLTEDERKLLIEKGLFEEQGNFWDEVKAIHGIEVDVDYGNTDPESAQGAAKRDQALMDMAAANQLEFLKTTYPDAFQILEHVANGGSVTDLVNSEEPDFSKITLDKDDKESQKDLLMNFYMAKGFSEKDSKRYIEADEDSSEGLLVVAQNALKQLATAQEQKQKSIIEEQKAKQAKIAERNTAFKQGIKQIADAGKLGDFTIMNKKDRDDFYQFAVSNIYADGKNGYQVVLPVNDKSMIPVLQQLFFSFKGGKLDEFVKREAQTQNVRKLQRKASQIVNKTNGQENTEAQAAAAGKGKALPTFDIFNAE